MIFNYIHKINFYNSIFENGRIPIAYKKLLLKKDDTLLFTSTEVPHELKDIHSYELFPNYLAYNIADKLELQKVFQKKGYAIDLKEYIDINDYLKKHCKGNFRNNILRSVKRIETSFNIKYKHFYGEINNEVYTVLMSALLDMLTKRFEQRSDKNIILENWDYYLETTQELILRKKASLFVIYNETQPIAISLNHHFGPVLYFSIPSFDLDYSKFTLGNVVIYKMVAWCIQNQILLFDMGYGGFENKRNWCNTTYNFEHHIIYSSKAFLGKALTFLIKYKYLSINYLISKNINVHYRQLRHKMNRKKVARPAQNFTYKFEGLSAVTDEQKLTMLPINMNEKENNYLIKPTYDFLYLHKEHIDDITIFAIQNEINTFVVIGKNKVAKIISSK